jgi:putative FmdB family regulatory protein
MPIYPYHCTHCLVAWDALLPISERDSLSRSVCRGCGHRTVERVVAAPVMGVDATVSPGANFKELTRKMSRGLPKSAQINLERAASLRGRKYGPQ